MLLSGQETIWNSVLQMDDPLRVQYEVVEELFCQKKIVVADPSAEKLKKKEPKEVGLVWFNPLL